MDSQIDTAREMVTPSLNLDAVDHGITKPAPFPAFASEGVDAQDWGKPTFEQYGKLTLSYAWHVGWKKKAHKSNYW